MDYRFKVNLKGVISILSNHLYSTPDVFLRELTQNCCDAITVRQKSDPEMKGSITYELIEGKRPVLMIEDNGCGLTEEEIHKFLATIGMSSKREEEDLISARRDFIGQFGIGLLSAFMVCDEIVVYTRSYKDGSKTYEWIGKSDGTYSLKESKNEINVGTKVFIHASEDKLKHFDAENIAENLQKYCSFLNHELKFVANEKEVSINRQAPWRNDLDQDLCSELALELAAEQFNSPEILDTFKLESDFLSGHAFLMPGTSLGGARKNSVYIRNMYLNSGVADLLPEWACMFGLIINSDDLTPSASRESLHEDGYLNAARQEIERSLNVYLQRISESRPEIMNQLIKKYESILKNVASQNLDFLKIIHPHLTYESSIGRMSYKELSEQSEKLFFVSDTDEFHKVAPIACSSGNVIINAGYSFEPTLMYLLRHELSLDNLQPLDSEALLSCITSPKDKERQTWDEFLSKVGVILADFNVEPELCRFSPAQIPVIYFEDEKQREQRRIQKYKEEANDLFSSMIEHIQPELPPRDILINIDNEVINSLKEIDNEDKIAAVIKLLYIQSLLLGRHSLGMKELNLLNENLGKLIEFSIK